MNPRILLLTLGTFAIGTEGYVIAGVLPTITGDLGVSIAAGGMLVTVFALVYALGSPVLAALLGHWPRRQVLLGGLAVFTLGNLLAAFAPSFGMLVFARLIAALGAALYTPTASAAAVALSRPERRGQALSLVSGGLTVAIVLGVPLGTWVGHAFGWRMTFVMVSAMSGLALLGGALLLPSFAASAALGLRQRMAPLARPPFLAALSLSVIWITGAFTVYPYLSPLLGQITHLDYAGVSLMLLIFGVASMLGIFLGGYVADRWGSGPSIPISLGVLILILALLPMAAATGAGAALAMAVWGISGWSVSVPQQHRLIALAPNDAAVALALNSSAMYLGQALGAVVGGAMADASQVWLLGPAGAVIEVAALAAVLLAMRRPARVGAAEQVA